MNQLLFRTFLLLLHLVANFVLISYVFRYDITGSWIGFIGFIILAFFLFYLFIRHLISYINFTKTKTK